MLPALAAHPTNPASGVHPVVAATAWPPARGLREPSVRAVTLIDLDLMVVGLFRTHPMLCPRECHRPCLADCIDGDRNGRLAWWLEQALHLTGRRICRPDEPFAAVSCIWRAFTGCSRNA
ncbi:MAG: hypothetical protein R3E68_21780 [Burkholderiaceae bacterium]